MFRRDFLNGLVLFPFIPKFSSNNWMTEEEFKLLKQACNRNILVYDSKNNSSISTRLIDLMKICLRRNGDRDELNRIYIYEKDSIKNCEFNDVECIKVKDNIGKIFTNFGCSTQQDKRGINIILGVGGKNNSIVGCY